MEVVTKVRGRGRLVVAAVVVPVMGSLEAHRMVMVAAKEAAMRVKMEKVADAVVDWGAT